MSEINPQLVKTLRDKTNAGMMDCKRALAECDGDLEKAEDLLRKKGILKAGSKSSRATKEGVIASYIHMQGKVGVLVEINCETDFVAKNEAFRDFVKDITLHIAASSPICVSRESVPASLVAREREIAIAQLEEEGKKSGKPKPANIVEKIVEGKIDKFLAGICLLDQPFIKNPDQTINDFVKSKIAELGENIVIRRFTRYMVGEAIESEKVAE
ncbi:MAG: translation elongation factor Ts [Verrucomicrobia bacterium]|nr:translation elongation factor Ts [Verrucomicrobiota bacterium]